jgi:uncharacterized protein (DUF1786 family)
MPLALEASRCVQTAAFLDSVSPSVLPSAQVTSPDQTLVVDIGEGRHLTINIEDDGSTTGK